MAQEQISQNSANTELIAADISQNKQDIDSNKNKQTEYPSQNKQNIDISQNKQTEYSSQNKQNTNTKQSANHYKQSKTATKSKNTNKNFFAQFDNRADFFRKCYLTFLFSGLSPKAPGTAGTLLALPFGWAIFEFLHPSTLFLLALAASALGAAFADFYEKRGDISHDRKEIVIDELAGVWIAISMLGNSALGLFLSFVLFRFFDITKPSIIGRIDRKMRGGWGIMCDDLAAGFFAGILGYFIFFALVYFGLIEAQEYQSVRAFELLGGADSIQNSMQDSIQISPQDSIKDSIESK